MTDIQRSLLDLLLEIDEICQEHGITYYIDGGTALGAVRHRGFLPWDDDADIMFTRENWLKFEKAVRENPRPNRVIEGMHNRKDYTMVYARYCDTSTTCILRTSMVDQFQSGLFIDLFILDPIPDTPESHREYFEILHGYCEYLNPYYYDEIVGVNKWYEKFKAMGEAQGRQAVIDYVEKKLFSYEDGEGMTYGFRYDRGQWIYPRDVVGKQQYVVFEDTKLPVAEKAEDYLRIHYGDNWHMVPKATEAETHNVVIDLHVPYAQFAESYMGRINRTEAIGNYEKLHDLRTKQRQATEQIDKTNYNTAAQLFARMFHRRMEAEGRGMRALVEARDYDYLRQMLANYYDMQLNRWFLHYKVFVALEDEHLYGALYLQLVDGDYSKADKILRLRREQSAPLSPDLLEIEQLIEAIRNTVRMFEERRYDKALEYCRAFGEKHPDIPQFKESEIRARAMLALKDGDAAAGEAILGDIEQLDPAMSAQDRIAAVRGLLTECFVDRKEGLAELEYLLESTSDGMLRLEIMDHLDCLLNTDEDAKL